MAFQAESEMIEVGLDAIQALAPSGARPLREFSYGAGRTDVVLVKQSDHYFRHRTNKLGIAAPIQEDDKLRCFLQAHSRPEITQEYFLSIGALPRSEKRQALDWLLSRGFVERCGEEKIRTAPRLRRHVTTSVAVEFKRRKWRDALEQAFQGKAYSEYQFVVLDGHHKKSALENLEIFREHEVGLASLDRGGKLEVHYDPPKSQPFSPLNAWRLNECSFARSLDCCEFAPVA